MDKLALNNVNILETAQIKNKIILNLLKLKNLQIIIVNTNLSAVS